MTTSDTPPTGDVLSGTSPRPPHVASPTARRSFLARLIAAAAAFTVVDASLAHAQGAAPRRTDADEPWMARLHGTNRVIIHAHEPTGALALRWAQTYLDTQRTEYGLTDDASSVVLGFNGKSIGLLFNDALWGRYEIGATLQMPGMRNAQTTLVAQLRSRGVTLLVCNNSLRAAGQRFLGESARSDAQARTTFADEARANLLPGVEIVPAMIVTLQQAQERGCRYIYAGA